MYGYKCLQFSIGPHLQSLPSRVIHHFYMESKANDRLFFFLGESQKYFLTTYKEAKGRSLVQFWIDSVCDRRVLDLLIPDSLDQPQIIEEVLDISRPDYTESNTSGAIDNRNVHKLNSDSLENFDDKENFLCEDTCEPTVLRDTYMTSETRLHIDDRTDNERVETFAETSYEKICTDAVTQSLKKDSVLRRLEKVRCPFVFPLFVDD